MTPSPERSLSVRLALSHLLVTSFVGLIAAGVVYGTFYWVEDRAYRATVEAALDAALHERSSRAVGPLSAHPVAEGSPTLQALATESEDGHYEWDHAGMECHVALATAANGERWMAVLEIGEIEQDPKLGFWRSPLAFW